MNYPSISIVTCSYQQGKFLEATIRSVIEQNYPNLDFLVIDGGSTDETVEVIKRYADRMSYWVSERDAGQTHALVKGFRLSRGEIMGWLCSDDLLLPNALQIVADYFTAHPNVEVVYGDALWIDRNGKFIRCKREMPFSRFVMLHDHNYLAQPSTFWRRRLYEDVGGLDTSFNLAMDADLWERFSKRAKFVHIPKYLSGIRSYPEQKTYSLRARSLHEDAIVRSRSEYAGKVPTPLLRPLARVARVASKFVAGGYMARAPQQHLEWLARFVIS